MSNSFGSIFRVTTFGESHCRMVGAVVDGCPPRLELAESDIQPQLDRRRPGQNSLTTPRSESDTVTIVSGVENGLTLGTPVALLVPNKDQRPGDYSEMDEIPRPSHADFTYLSKYGIKASSGGGRSSARETIGRVAAGAIAEKILRTLYGIEIVAWVHSVGEIAAEAVDMNLTDRTAVDASAVRCPDPSASEKMVALINRLRDQKDSTGGTVICACRNVPAGWGDPVFDKLQARFAHAMMSLPATRGFEIGSGFGGTKLRGSEHNDPFIRKDGRLGTVTNNSGGIQGGISNGEMIYFKTAFKPPATIGKPQETSTYSGEPATLEAKGRHDPCVVPRAVPIVEAMAALILVDAALSQKTIR
jgi:chorismate synthase